MGEIVREGSKTDRAVTKPALLMLSHCVPSAVGNPSRARAWQLLRLASHSYRVFLICRHDGPVRLDQWYSIQGHTEHVVMQATPLLCAAMGGPVGWFDAARGQRLTMSHCLGDAVAAWRREHRFDAVLCTHPALWPQAGAVAGELSVCDLDTPTGSARQRLTQNMPAAQRQWNQRRQRSLQIAERLVARQCSIVTISNPEDKLELQSAPCRTLVLPIAVDPDYFSGGPAVAAEDPGHPRLVFHANWTHPSGTHTRDWFAREVWPAVHQAVPEATLSCTDSLVRVPAPQALGGASVVVSPEADPTVSRWPILQALAMHRPVVASGSAVSDMLVRHGEHLLLSRRPSDWVDHCVASLRSARMRLALSHGARDYVQSHGRISQTGRELLAAFHSQYAKPMRINLAA